MARARPTGTGWFIWQLDKILDRITFARMVEILHASNASWVSIKMLDGMTKKNNGAIPGGDVGLRRIIDDLHIEGFQVGGWAYVYSGNLMSPGGQAGAAGERYQKFPLDHWKVDAEENPGNWCSDPNNKRHAAVYMGQLKGAGVPDTAPVALCSFRQPTTYQPTFPARTFLHTRENNPNDYVAQQLYWIGRHNPTEQLVASMKEYEALKQGNAYVPIGPAWHDDRSNWEPTISDLQTFIVDAAKLGCSGVGFWSLDWVIQHNRMDWIKAIGAVSGGGTPPPPPPPPPPPEEVDTLTFKYTGSDTQSLTVRQAPNAGGARVGALAPGTVFEASDVGGSSAWVQLADGPYKGNWVCVQLNTSHLCEVVK